MNLSAAIRTVLTLDPRIALQKAGSWGRRLVAARYRNFAERNKCTYPAVGEAPPPHRTVKIPLSVLLPLAGNIQALTARVMAHRFDLLGSGWVSVAYGAEAPGFDGVVYPPESKEHGNLLLRLTPGNRERAGAIRALIDGGFTSIDWQRDLRSGFRWREDKVSQSLLYGHLPGIDVKSPWELARLQHLPWLVWAFVLSSGGETNFSPREVYLREFRNQVLDFWAANPPGYGVNWMCAMDVAIRAANIALAYDMFRAHGVEFDSGFKAEMDALLRAHGRHVVDNLEWHPKRRGNHYLANVAGLSFIACALPRSGETDSWLAFATQELIAETERQFLPDGSNFEASTSYHRLSAEMVTFATALIMGLPRDRREAFNDYNHMGWKGAAPLNGGPMRLFTLPNGAATQGPFPPGHFRKLERMADFSAHITKPNGKIAQIGDTDSGRFFKLAPMVEQVNGTVRETHLDHRTLVGAVNGFFDRADRSDFAGPAGAVASNIVAGLARTKLHSYREAGQSSAASGVGVAFKDVPGGNTPRPNLTTTIRLPAPEILEGLHLCRYPDFGLYIWASKRLFLAIRCGNNAHDGVGAHAHNDQLSIELNVDGEDWLADPGTYVYTADLAARNAYRSVAAHGAPRWKDEEPAPLNQGPFRLPDSGRGTCLGFNQTEFVGVHHGYGFPMVRRVVLEDGAIVVTDTPSGGPRTHEYASARTGEELRALFGMSLPFSRGYGLKD